jgi:hypothetical protein
MNRTIAAFEAWWKKEFGDHMKGSKYIGRRTWLAASEERAKELEAENEILNHKQNQWCIGCPRYARLMKPFRQALMEIRAKARFELDQPTGLHATCLGFIAKVADETLAASEKGEGECTKLT